MYIHEAISKISYKTPFITRKSWQRITDRPCPASVKIQPSNSPDCCIVFSVSMQRPSPRWNPTADDLTASDWELTR